jgi:hypothetical protein
MARNRQAPWRGLHKSSGKKKICQPTPGRESSSGRASGPPRTKHAVELAGKRKSGAPGRWQVEAGANASLSACHASQSLPLPLSNAHNGRKQDTDKFENLSLNLESARCGIALRTCCNYVEQRRQTNSRYKCVFRGENAYATIN